MFIGHYAVGFAAKRFAPRTSLGILVLAANFLDIMRSAAIVLGIENTHVYTNGSLPELYHQTISHSLVIAIVSSALFGGIHWWKWRELTSAFVVGGAVLSHWLLDFLTYPSILPLYPGSSTNVGLGLLVSVKSGLIVEGLLLVIGVFFYLRSTNPKTNVGRFGFATFILLIVSAYVAGIMQIEFNERVFAGFVVFTLLIPVWAQWFDEHREGSKTERTAWLEKLTAMLMPLFRYERPAQSEVIATPPINKTRTIPGERSLDPRPGPKIRRDIKPQIQEGKPRRTIPAALLVLTILVVTGVAIYLGYSALFGTTGRGLRSVRSAEEIKRDKINKAVGGKPVEIRASLHESVKLSKDVEQVLLEDEDWEDKHVGGAIAVAISNWASDRQYKSYKSIENLGFRRVTNPEALVNRVLNNEIRIDHMELTPVFDEISKKYTKFKVSMKLTNLNPRDPVEYYVHKGQIFEVKGSSPAWKKDYLTGLAPEKPPQPVATSRDGPPRTIPPADSTDIDFEAYCVDEGLSLPYGPAGVAIFELIKTNYHSPGQLHDMIEGIRSNTIGATSLGETEPPLWSHLFHNLILIRSEYENQ